mmetsp:Transcript_17185/g.15185  ORF Transcript_17185/g.15185 Transcript_17185/m.15185 type:complete len:285 (+) Transcript_17185:579-1433(+)
MVFKYYIKNMKSLYYAYSGKHCKPGEQNFMCSDEFLRLFSDAGVQSDLFGAKEIGIIFNLSMMTQVDELNSDRFYRMTFDEFIEGVARVADGCNLLLVSSSYFGVDLESAMQNEKKSKFNEKQVNLMPDQTEKGIFDPENIMKAHKNETFSEISSDSDGAIIVPQLDESLIEKHTHSDKVKLIEDTQNEISELFKSQQTIGVLASMEIERVRDDSKFDKSRKNSSSRLISELNPELNIANELYEQIDLADKIEFLLIIMTRNCLGNDAQGLIKKKNGWKLLIED